MHEESDDQALAGFKCNYCRQLHEGKPRNAMLVAKHLLSCRQTPIAANHLAHSSCSAASKQNADPLLVAQPGPPLAALSRAQGAFCPALACRKHALLDPPRAYNAHEDGSSPHGFASL